MVSPASILSTYSILFNPKKSKPPNMVSFRYIFDFDRLFVFKAVTVRAIKKPLTNKNKVFMAPKVVFNCNLDSWKMLGSSLLYNAMATKTAPKVNNSKYTIIHIKIPPGG